MDLVCGRRKLSDACRLLGGLALLTCQARHLLVHLKHIEAHSLGERTALANDHLITRTGIEGRRAVGRDHLVTLLVTTVLLLVVKVVTTDGDGVLHESPVDDATQQLATDGHLADERALLVDVAALLSLGGHFEAQANALHLTRALAGGARQETSLAGEDVGLLLVRTLSLHVHG